MEATRPESFFERERAKEQAFIKRHPILAALISLGALLAMLWQIITRIFG